MILGTQDKDFFPKDITEKLKFVKKIGFDSFEIDGKLLVDNIEEVKQAMEETGVKIYSVCGGYRGWIGDFIEERRLTAIEDLKEILRAISEIGGRGVVVPAAWGMFTFRLPPMVSPRTVEGDKKAIIDSLKELDEVAGKYRVKLFLEPLNRYQDHMLNTLEDAVNIIEEGNLKNVLITADFYHMNIEEDDISEALLKYKDYIGNVHIAENHRYQPGTGTIDFERHFNTLRNIGYDGAIINEGRIRGKQPLEAYVESINYTRKFL